MSISDRKRKKDFDSPNKFSNVASEIPWFPRFDFTLQDASSMLFQKIIPSLQSDPIRNASMPPLKVLDLCAAPGGKSGVLSSLLPINNSILVSNELIENRCKILAETSSKFGFPSSLVTQNKSEDFVKAGLKQYFDIVIVDAPCSGEGLFRREISRDLGHESLKLWSPKLIRQQAKIQQKLIDDAILLVNPGMSGSKNQGVLVYMTCTFEDEENEKLVEYVYKQYGCYSVSPIKIEDLDSNWGVKEVDIDIGDYCDAHSVHPAYYCLPGKIKGEGLFIAAFSIGDKIGPKRTQISTDKVSEKSRKIIPSAIISNLSKISRKEEELVSNFVSLKPNFKNLSKHFFGDISTEIKFDILKSSSHLSKKFTNKILEKKELKLKKFKKNSNHNDEKLFFDKNKFDIGHGNTECNSLLHVIPKSTKSELIELTKKLNVQKFGIHCGEIKSAEFFPSTELALSSFLKKADSKLNGTNNNKIFEICLNYNQSLLFVQGKQFLTKEEFKNLHLKIENDKSWAYCIYKEYCLGWCTIIRDTINKEENYRINIKLEKNYRAKRTLWEIE
ncbi:hypothetical protein HK099_004509 [Clydaea vesicula]|uniref:SAM-dependent MTase RsmB/NOP-type domain-containing protein n=1 Tax=Clydaea vesicula TaxID=447962 RepID=A0AAD5U6U5_9FUNG|nr:hypothetical protein HK099_004509 [Clydaea vesicula]